MSSSSSSAPPSSSDGYADPEREFVRDGGARLLLLLFVLDTPADLTDLDDTPVPTPIDLIVADADFVRRHFANASSPASRSRAPSPSVIPVMRRCCASWRAFTEGRFTSLPPPMLGALLETGLPPDACMSGVDEAARYRAEVGEPAYVHPLASFPHAG
jgi:hypothetical protein